MKKLSLIAVMLLVAGILNAEVTIKTSLPNLEVTTLNSWKTGSLESAATSKVLMINKIDFRLGYVPNSKKIAGAFSYDLKNLESVGLNITYLWSGLVNSSIGFFCGYDFSSDILVASDRVDYGGMLVILSIGLK